MPGTREYLKPVPSEKVLHCVAEGRGHGLSDKIYRVLAGDAHVIRVGMAVVGADPEGHFGSAGVLCGDGIERGIKPVFR